MTNVCLIGLGRTGMEIARVIMEQRDMKLVAAICSDFSSKAGKDIGEILGLPDTGAKIYTSSQLNYVLEKLKPDVFVDFSNYKATMNYVASISEKKAALVIGTTGFSKTDILRMKVLTKKNGSGILHAPNITVGVNVMMLLSNITARILSDYDFEISEAHHKYKKDSPSGTALKIADQVEEGLQSSGVEINESIPIHAVRAGGIVGRHELMIAGDNDKIEIVHESFNRKAFADGALKGIRFIKGKRGFFGMQDVLDLERALASYFDKRKITIANSSS
ncbi:MAG: 4-hydroxy-tetrahydrodipicolinate reductase [Clostridiaceae bacterium]|nr:4-hydroxy-tetrahydrodipicolinate reductase [Clostridiaceae bacterium]